MNDITVTQVIWADAYSSRRKLTTYKASSPKKIRNCAQSTGSRRNRRTSLIISERINRPRGVNSQNKSRSAQIGRAGRLEGSKPCKRLKVARNNRRARTD